MTEASDPAAVPDVVRRALRDGAWNATALVVPGLVNILITAYLFRTLGPVGFAPWATVVALLGLLTILDAGLSVTTARNAARAIAGDPDGIRLVRAAYAAYAGLGVIVLVIGLAVAPIGPAILGLSGEPRVGAIVVGVFLAADLTIVISTAGWLGTLRGARRFDLLVAASVTQVLVALPATIWLVPALGLPGAAIAQLAGRLVGRLVAALALRRVVPWIGIRPTRVPRADLLRIGIFALPILAIAVSTQLGVGSDPVVVALAAGPAAVGLYAAGSGLVRYVAYLLFPVLAVLLPSFSEVSYSRPDAIASIVVRCVRLAAAIGVIVFGSLAVTAGPVLQLWIGRTDALSVEVLAVYAVAHAAWTPSQVLVLALIASGRHGVVGAVLVADAVLNVALSLVLVFAIGPVGVALSSLVMLVAAHSVAIPLIAIRRLGIAPWELVRSIAAGAAVGLVVVGVVALVPGDDLPGLAIRVAIAGVAALGVLVLDQAVFGRRAAAVAG